jgi:hypothetical protein
LTAHYSDAGVLPRAVLLSEFSNSWWISAHFLSGKPFFQGVLFAFAAVCAVSLLTGYRTRLAVIVSWFLIVSLHNRNPVVLNSGDTLLRLLLFWSMFLPLGARWSADSATTGGANEKTVVLSGATVAFILQVCFVYWFMVLRRNGSVWWTGEALSQALSLEHYDTWLTPWLRDRPPLMRFLNYLVLGIEAVGSVLILSPIATGPIRTLVIVGFFVLHMGIASTMRIGFFPFVSMIAFIPFLPAWFWENTPIGRRTEEVMNRARDHALVRAGRSLSWPKRAERPASPWTSLLTDVSCIVLISFVFLWNIRAYGSPAYREMLPRSLNPVAYALRLDQSWRMFSPHPPTSYGWYVVPGRLLDGSEVDLFRQGAPVDWSKPDAISNMYVNNRWRKYHLNLALKDYRGYRLYYGKYLTRQWNARHRGDDRVSSFEIVFMQIRTNASPEAEPERIRLWRHQTGVRDRRGGNS